VGRFNKDHTTINYTVPRGKKEKEDPKYSINWQEGRHRALDSVLTAKLVLIIYLYIKCIIVFGKNTIRGFIKSICKEKEMRKAKKHVCSYIYMYPN